jgi:hypothetical protein
MRAAGLEPAPTRTGAQLMEDADAYRDSVTHWATVFQLRPDQITYTHASIPGGGMLDSLTAWRFTGKSVTDIQAQLRGFPDTLGAKAVTTSSGSATTLYNYVVGDVLYSAGGDRALLEPILAKLP